MYKFVTTIYITSQNDVMLIQMEFGDEEKFLVYNKENFYNFNELLNLDWSKLLQDNPSGVPVHVYKKIENE